jgi:hypothetical protein
MLGGFSCLGRRNQPSPRQITNTKEDQLHVEPGSNCASHRQAFFDQQILQQRQARDQARTNIQNDSAAHEANRIAATRDLNTEFAALKKPRGGTSVGNIPQLTKVEIEGAALKVKKEILGCT